MTVLDRKYHDDVQPLVYVTVYAIVFSVLIRTDFNHYVRDCLNYEKVKNNHENRHSDQC